MTNEKRQLLIKDLCARLPYGVKFPYHMEEDSNHRECDCIATINSISEDMVEFTYLENGRPRDWSCCIPCVKPYLRPMSSMTEEEKEEFLKLADGDDDDFEDIVNYPNVFGLTVSIETFDWLNAHHFDYRGLIKKRLALEAKEGMYE